MTSKLVFSLLISFLFLIKSIVVVGELKNKIKEKYSSQIGHGGKNDYIIGKCLILALIALGVIGLLNGLMLLYKIGSVGFLLSGISTSIKLQNRFQKKTNANFNVINNAPSVFVIMFGIIMYLVLFIFPVFIGYIINI